MAIHEVEWLGSNLIGYDYSADGALKYKSFNPVMDQENPWIFSQATESEIDNAAKKAAEAFPQYASLSGPKRADFLETIIVEIEKNKNEILETYVAESGLPLGRAEGELARTLGQIQKFASIARVGQWTDPIIDIKGGSDIRKTNVPIGPVAVFGASNFPLAFSTAGGDTISALAVGCPVVVKAHPMHSGTSSLVAQAVLEASKKTKMPEGVFSHLLDYDNSVGAALVKHPSICGVGFTGSFTGGKALKALSEERESPIPVFAEMGSINPVVVFREIVQQNGAHWASALAGSINLGAGQFCTNPGLILGVQGDAFKSFVQQLSDELTNQKPACMLHPKIFGAYKERSQIMEDNGVEVVAVGKNEMEKANFAVPKLTRVSGAMFLENSNLQREVFGPFSLVVECADVDELNRAINKLEGQLTGTVLGTENELRAHAEVISNLQSKVGRLIHNGVPTGVEVCGAMQHGGPYPATSDSRFTSVGDDSIKRWVRPVAFQNWPSDMLPQALQDGNPLNLLRKLNGDFTSQRINQ